MPAPMMAMRRGSEGFVLQEVSILDFDIRFSAAVTSYCNAVFVTSDEV